MTSLSTIGHLQIPAEWKHLDTSYVGPFVTRITHELNDGSIHVWSSRRHRKGFGPEIVLPGAEAPSSRQRPTLLVWAPHKLNWWIAVLFMIGSFGFILGSVLFLGGYTNYRVINATFFIGSIFFTSAGYSQFNRSINASPAVGVELPKGKRKWFAFQPKRIDFWVTFSSFLARSCSTSTPLMPF